MNNKNYVDRGGESFYQRNRAAALSPFIIHLQSLFSDTVMRRSRCCELGCGVGNNLKSLSESYREVDGYEVVPDAVVHAKTKITEEGINNVKVYARDVVNDPPELSQYDVSILGFFPYYCDDEDMAAFHNGAVDTVKQGSYVYVYDFLAREAINKNDSHTTGLKVYKRPLSWWLQFFDGFDMIDFRLFSSSEARHGIASFDWVAAAAPDDWEFSGLFCRQ